MHKHTHTHTHIQTMDYYSVLNISELSGHEKIWRKLKCTLLRERSQLYAVWLQHRINGKTKETVERSVVARG